VQLLSWGGCQGQRPFSQNLKVVPPDLTVLARKNGGVFPADRISSLIDGRTRSPATVRGDADLGQPLCGQCQ